MLLFLGLTGGLCAQIEVVSNGNVGIGTSTPSAKLHIKETDGTTPLYIQGAASNAFILLNSDQALFLGAAQQADAGTTTRNSVYMALRGNYWNGSNHTNVDTNIQNVVSGVNAYRMVFRTANTERMAIDQSGNVGIGTTAPTAPLHIYRGSQAEVRLQNESRQWALLSNTAWGGSGLSLYDITADDSRLQISTTGNVGIGTINPGYKLEVVGSVRATSFISNTTTYADFVFKPGYKLPSLSEVEAHIEAHGTLPGVPSEAQVAKEGIDLAAMQVKLLQKIEELTLHVIRQEKEIQALKAKHGSN